MNDIIENMFFRHNPMKLGVDNKGIIIKSLYLPMAISRVGNILEQKHSHTLVVRGINLPRTLPLSITVKGRCTF